MTTEELKKQETYDPYPGIKPITDELIKRAQTEMAHFGMNFGSNEMTVGQIKHLSRIIETLLHIHEVKIVEYLEKLEMQQKQDASLDAAHEGVDL